MTYRRFINIISYNQSVEERVLPSDYTEVLYITNSTGEEYIDTGIKINDKIGFKGSYEGVSKSGMYALGFYGNHQMGIDYQSLYWCTTDSSSSDSGCYWVLTTGSAGDYQDVEYNYKQSGKAVANTNTETISWFVESTKSIYLFRLQDIVLKQGGIKWYGIKFSHGQNIIRDFRPCVRNSDGVVGMYDIINDVFYTNKGKGKLIAGYEERYIEGYANTGSTVSFQMNDTVYEAERDSSTGYFKYSITDNLGNDFEITSLKQMFSTAITGYGSGDGVITYVNLEHIGDTSKSTSNFNMFYNQKTLTAVNFGSKFSTKSSTSMKAMFNNCTSLSSIDVSMFDLSNVGTSGDNTCSTIFYQCSGLESIKLCTFPSTCYYGNSVFAGCSSLTDISCSGSIDVGVNNATFRLQDTAMTSDSIYTLFMKSFVDHTGSTLANLCVNGSQYEGFTDEQKKYITSMNWSIINMDE